MMPRPRNLVPALACAVLMASASAGAVRAQEQDTIARRAPTRVYADRAPYELRFDHVTGAVEVRDESGEVVEAWESRGVIRATAPLAEVPPDRPLLVLIRNANTLLYDYSIEVAPVGARRDVRSCVDIGGQFSSRAFLTGISAIGVGNISGLQTADPATFFPGDTFEDYVRQMVAAMGGARGGARGALSAAELARSFAEVERPVERLVASLDSLQALATSLPDSLRRVAALADATPIDPLLVHLLDRLESVDERLADPTRVSEVVRDRLRANEAPVRALIRLATGLEEGEYDVDPRAPLPGRIRALRSRLETEIADSDEWIPLLQKSVLEIERAREGSLQSFTLASSGGHFRRVAIQARKPETRYEGVIAVRAGTVELYTAPRMGVRCRISLGFGMMSNPKEFAVQDGVLVNERDDDLRTAATLNFHIGPADLPLAAMFGIGIGVESAPDFYVGGTLAWLEPILINAGVAFLRQQRLPDGVRLGDPADPSLLDTIERRYVPAFFAGLGIAP